MSTMAVPSTLKAQVLGLPGLEREELVQALLESLDDSATVDVSGEERAEIGRAVAAAAEATDANFTDGDDVLEELRALP